MIFRGIQNYAEIGVSRKIRKGVRGLKPTQKALRGANWGGVPGRLGRGWGGLTVSRFKKKTTSVEAKLGGRLKF